MFVYLDNSATTRQYDEVTDLMVRVMNENFGNPSSLHRLGMDSEKIVRNARKKVAVSLGAKEEEILFTSGGTESDNTALWGACQSRKRRGKKIITSKVEHPAISEPCKRLEEEGFEVSYIDVDEKGTVDVQAFERELTEDTICISVMTVNNETGTIMPIKEMVEIKERFNREHGTDILFHTDAVQAYGKIPLNLSGIDMVSISGHKIHGPKGVGALYIRKGLNIKPFIVGGGQEKNMRSGTENVPAIAGFGLAAEIATKNLSKRIEKISFLREILLKEIKENIDDIKVNSVEESGIRGESSFCCPSVLNVSFLGTRGEVILHTLEQSGIYVSTGSACSSNKKGMSHVLKSMGLKDKEIEGAIRFSFNEFITEADIKYTVEELKRAVTGFRALGSFR